MTIAQLVDASVVIKLQVFPRNPHDKYTFAIKNSLQQKINYDEIITGQFCSLCFDCKAWCGLLCSGSKTTHICKVIHWIFI